MPGDHAVGITGRTINKKRITLLVTALLILVLLLAFYRFAPSPSKQLKGDSDGDGQLEIYQLAESQVTVTTEDAILWESDPAWKVTDLVLADADNDGQEEMLLVLWKKGSFGTSKPMWMKGEDTEYSNHLFMYRLVAGRMKPVWCSSAIEYPILRLQVEDHDDDGLQELLVTEGPAAGPFYSIRQLFYKKHTTWQWQEWGFALENS
ncbi:MAG TPA: hypothetical protein PLM20_06920 [Syntrophomonadaceae bacterium]|nr:hypothetical protein [Syntrophomonadaceae bacterium]